MNIALVDAFRTVQENHVGMGLNGKPQLQVYNNNNI